MSTATRSGASSKKPTTAPSNPVTLPEDVSRLYRDRVKVVLPRILNHIQVIEKSRVEDRVKWKECNARITELEEVQAERMKIKKYRRADKKSKEAEKSDEKEKSAEQKKESPAQKMEKPASGKPFNAKTALTPQPATCETQKMSSETVAPKK